MAGELFITNIINELFITDIFQHIKGRSFLGPVSISSCYSRKSSVEAAMVYIRNATPLSCAPPGRELRVTKGNGPVHLHPSKIKTSAPSPPIERVSRGATNRGKQTAFKQEYYR